MTCIVGLISKKGVYIGGDSAGVAGYSLTVRADDKVFANNGFLFGFTSSFRMGQILRFGFTPPKRHLDVDIYEYMVTDFIDAVRTRFRTAGYLATTNGEERGGTFLVAHRGRLFKVEGDFQVGESTDGYDACGCGDSIALGALYATKVANGFSDPEAAVRTSLMAAEGYSAGVRSPFKVMLLPSDTDDHKKSTRK